MNARGTQESLFPSPEAAFDAAQREIGRISFPWLGQVLLPWLGQVRILGASCYPGDVCIFAADIRGHGFRRLAFRTLDANPPWIRPNWRTPAGAHCFRCGLEIQALLKTHRVAPYRVTGAPHIFCDCVRLTPSWMPSLQFFTDHWSTALEAIDYAATASLDSKTGDRRRINTSHPGEGAAP